MRLTNLKCSWVSNFPFFTALYMCKAAILSFYLQLFPTFMHLRRKILWAAITYTFISYVLSLLLNTFLCHPIRRNWYAIQSLQYDHYKHRFMKADIICSKGHLMAPSAFMNLLWFSRSHGHYTSRPIS